MLQALKQHLLENPRLYLDETVAFLWDEFEAVGRRVRHSEIRGPKIDLGKGSHFLFSGSNDVKLAYCKIVYSSKEAAR